jgi:hypothetical protein
MPRPIYEIAADIRRNWAKPNYAAVPYLNAMSELNSIDDNYYADTAKYVVTYFLSNARAFRGEDAKRLKAELKSL